MALQHRIRAARGKIKSDLVLKNANYLNVFTGTWQQGDIAIHEGKIVGMGVGESYLGQKQMDLSGKYVVPGFIDSHVHIESTMMTPDQYQRVVLRRGTTGAIVDPHEIANVHGAKGISYFLKCAEQSTMDLYVMLSSCVPATMHLETSGARLKAKDLAKFKGHKKVLGLAEMMNYPGVLNEDPEVMQKLKLFEGQNMDGHCPFLQGKDLNAYITAGIMSCHESVSLAEAQEKLEKGMQVLLREGSVAKNLKDLAPVLTAYSSPKVSLCSDDRNPVDIFDEGHLDYMIRIAIERGSSPEDVYRAASWSTANAYKIPNKGAIAPGFDADLVVMKDYRKVNVEMVFKNGMQIKTSKDIKKISAKPLKVNSIHYKVPDLKEFAVSGPAGEFRVIEVIANQIITKATSAKLKANDKKNILLDLQNDILKIAVLERHGKNRPLALGFVKGFGLKSGAVASSVGHDSHNVVSVGTNDSDMRHCFEWMKKNGGGFVAIENGKVLASQTLKIAGLMTDEPIENVYKNLKKLRAATSQMGCKLQEPFIQMAFLCLPVIPELKITDLGLVDVTRFELVPVRISSYK